MHWRLSLFTKSGLVDRHGLVMSHHRLRRRCLHLCDRLHLVHHVLMRRLRKGRCTNLAHGSTLMLWWVLDGLSGLRDHVRLLRGLLWRWWLLGGLFLRRKQLRLLRRSTLRLLVALQHHSLGQPWLL